MEKKEFAQKFANAFAQLGLNVIDDKTGKPLSEAEVAQLAEDNLVYTEHPRDYYEQLYRKKIKGWYSTKKDEDKAVKRMLKVRKEIITLLQSANRDGIENVIQYLDDRGFYYRASSPNGHHNFPGGLAEHSLGVYKYAKKAAKKYSLDEDSVKIAALLHDICKADRFWFEGRSIHKHHPKSNADKGHGSRSVMIIRNCGVSLSQQERRAIRWHMSDPNYNTEEETKDYYRAIKEDLRNVVNDSDHKDAADHPASHRKNQK